MVDALALAFVSDTRFKTCPPAKSARLYHWTLSAYGDCTGVGGRGWNGHNNSHWVSDRIFPATHLTVPYAGWVAERGTAKTIVTGLVIVLFLPPTLQEAWKKGLTGVTEFVV